MHVPLFCNILPTLHLPSSPQTGVAAGQEQLPSQTPVVGHSFCSMGCSREQVCCRVFKVAREQWSVSA